MSKGQASLVPPPTPGSARKHQIFCRLAARYIIPAGGKPEGVRVAFDIETDALLDAVTKIHCIVVIDLDSDRIDEFGPDQIDTALARLSEATYLVGHNILNFDLPILRRLHGWVPRPTCTIVDTLIAGRLILANVLELDKQAEAMRDPPLGKLNGRFSLEAWGARLGIPKVGADIEMWSGWTPEMQERCVGDARLTKALWRFRKRSRLSTTWHRSVNRSPPPAFRSIVRQPKSCGRNGRQDATSSSSSCSSSFPSSPI